jgi:hypothetical protein
VTASPPVTLPRWLTLGLGTALAWLCALGVAGVLLAMVGWFRLVPLVLATAAMAVPSHRRVGAGRAPGPVDRSTHVAAAARRGPGGGGHGWHLANHAQHLVADRDPGVYVTTARWLAAEGDLRVDGPPARSPPRRWSGPTGTGSPRCATTTRPSWSPSSRTSPR